MNKKYIVVFVILFVIIVSIFLLLNMSQKGSQSPLVEQNKNLDQTYIKNLSVEQNSGIESPLILTGEARTFYFEGSFPIEIRDANNKVIGSGIAKAQGDWMTSDFVSFKASITFIKSTTETGTILLKKDNPSGLIEYDKQVSIPIYFK